MPLLLKPVPPGRGPRWIGDAFRLFLRRPLGFAALFAVFLFAALVLGLMPGLGPLLQLAIVPMLSLGFMVAGQSALLGGPVRASQYVEPLRADAARRKALLLLCAGYGLVAFAIVVLADEMSNHAMARFQHLMSRGDSGQHELEALLFEPGVTRALLLSLLLVSLLSVPFWHAPALVHWGGQGAAQALFSSTLAVWRCKGAFTTYTLAWTGLAFAVSQLVGVIGGLFGAPRLAAFVGMLGGGIVLPVVFYLSVLFSFNDSFGGSSAADAQP